MPAAIFLLHWTTLLWLLAGMTMATVPFVGQLPLWLTALLIGMGVYRLYLAQAELPPPGRRLRFVMAAICIGGLIFSGHWGVGLDQALPFFVALLWIKLFELNTARDVLMACFLSFFLLAGELLSQPSLMNQVWALAACVVLFGALVHFHVGAQARRADHRRIRSLRVASIISAQGLPLALVMFLFLPRPEGGLALQESKAATGISDELRPGAIAQLAEDTSIAFRIEFPERHAINPADWYWRGLVLTEFDGEAWRRRPAGSVRGGAWTPDAEQVTAPPGGIAITQDIVLSPHRHAWLFALDCPLPLSPGANAGGARMRRGVVLEADRAVTSSLVYRVVSMPGARPRDELGRDRPFWSGFAEVLDRHGSRREALPAELSAEEAQRALRLDPRLLGLAERWRQAGAAATANDALGHALGDGSQQAAAVVRAGLDYFRDGGFVYTRNPGAMGANPVANFLFQKKAGFCGHYASAYALIASLAGVPTRVIVGYRGAELNPFGDFLVVRQSHAHAWCESWLGEAEGWRRVDPTEMVSVLDSDGRTTASDAQQARADAAGAGGNGWLARLKRGTSQRWDAVEAKWDRWMLGYGADTQKALLERLGLRLNDSGLLWTLAGISVALIGGIVVVLLLALRLRRRAHEPLARAYERFCRRLLEHGVTRSPWEGPTALGERAALLLPAAAAEIRAITADYARLRYGPPSALKPRALRQLQRRVHAFRPSAPARHS